MATITFDTHKFIRKLKDSGMPEEQAEAIADAFKDASGEAELATKRDIERLEGLMWEMRTEFSGKFVLVQWMMGLILGGVVALVMRAFFPA